MAKCKDCTRKDKVLALFAARDSWFYAKGAAVLLWVAKIKKTDKYPMHPIKLAQGVLGDKPNEKDL